MLVEERLFLKASFYILRTHLACDEDMGNEKLVTRRKWGA